ncbi:MAG: CBS domain-containing protein, partial [Candidatus Humimicrobiaceae bacterium]
AEKTAGEIMNKEVITIAKDKSLLELAELFIKNKISGVPVVDNENILQGMVSESDIVDFLKKDEMFLATLVFPVYNYIYLEPELYAEGYEKNKEALSKTKVEEIMHTWVRKAKRETFESEIAAIMSNSKVNRVPIVDDENKVIGIIARNDLVKSMVKRDNQ